MMVTKCPSCGLEFECQQLNPYDRDEIDIPLNHIDMINGLILCKHCQNANKSVDWKLYEKKVDYNEMEEETSS